MKTKVVKTLYGVFIIESLRDDDHKDGKKLKQILNLSLIENIYRSVDTIAAFVSAIDEFDKSTYRYLHLSCHANKKGIEIGGEFLSNKKMADIIKLRVRHRRIFFSACEASNLNTATMIITVCKGQSVVGSPNPIDEDKAALFWPAFYHVVNEIGKDSMNQQSISSTLQKCVDLFNIPINYYFRSKKNGHLRRYKIRPRLPKDKKTIKIAAIS